VTVASALLGFSLVAGLLTITPGLDTALVLRAALSQGRAHAYLTALGVASGVLVWGVAAAVGVSALLSASTLAYDVLRVVGAVYMVWLGVRLLRAAVRGTQAPEQTEAAEASPWRGWQRGLLTNVLNPKVGAFYLAVLPQFLPPGVPPLAMGALLAVTHDVLGMLWFTALIVGARRARGLLASRRATRTVDGVTGAVLVGFGLRLGLTR
jgi:threonine/homoserine/homoserine lactone efflux protein